MERVSSWLKAFVVGGGVLVLGGTIVLVALLISRAADRGQDTAASEGPLELILPPGSTVHEVVPDSRNRVLLLGTDGDGRQFIALVDPATGERLSLVRILTEGR